LPVGSADYQVFVLDQNTVADEFGLQIQQVTVRGLFPLQHLVKGAVGDRERFTWKNQVGGELREPVRIVLTLLINHYDKK
jgi:hypothetical protein